MKKQYQVRDTEWGSKAELEQIMSDEAKQYWKVIKIFQNDHHYIDAQNNACIGYVYRIIFERDAD